LTGIDDDLGRIEEWHASFPSYDPAVEDRRIAQEIPEHPDVHKPTKQMAMFKRETSRRGFRDRSMVVHGRYVLSDDMLEERIRIQRSISGDRLEDLMQQINQPMVHARLLLHGRRQQVIEVPENISQVDLRMRSPQHFTGRVQTVPERFPLRDGTIVNCIQSFVSPTGHPDESKCTVVPYLTYQRKHYPIEVWPVITERDLPNAASNVMERSCCVHGSTRYQIQARDEILIATP
jgi:hypothetical protein